MWNKLLSLSFFFVFMTNIEAADVKKILIKNACFSCHKFNQEFYAPTFYEMSLFNNKLISEGHMSKEEVKAKIQKSIKKGSWGKYEDFKYITMPIFEKQMSDEDFELISTWLLQLNK